MTLKRKIIVASVVVVVGGLAVWLGPGFYNDYKNWQFTKQMNQVAEELDKASKDEYKVMMADTYGGKTPAATLKMYIEAVEKGDYELASRYFVEQNRATELKTFQNAKQDDISNVQRLLDEALNKGDGSYSENGKEFVIHQPIFVHFVLFPNGIWKLLQI